MKKIDLGQAITILANIGVLAGIVALIVEIDQNSDHLALQLEFQANQKLFELNRELQDPVRAEIFAKAITNPDELSFGDGLVATTIVLNMINEWEERYWIERAGLTPQLGWKRHVQENIEWVLVRWLRNQPDTTRLVLCESSSRGPGRPLGGGHWHMRTVDHVV